MEVHASESVRRQITKWVQKAKCGDKQAELTARLLHDEVKELQGLSGIPTEESASLKRVRQSKKYPVWRVSHPFHAEIAVRLICWFDPDSESVVVALFAGDKLPMGDVFYDSVGSRADQIIEVWRVERKRHEQGK
ncbi:MAG: hypothetical protein JJE02_02940 [Propionibacteriales bacterium]|nr:hypothetical protein [Propionibacteriales bacterium]